MINYIYLSQTPLTGAILLGELGVTVAVTTLVLGKEFTPKDGLVPVKRYYRPRTKSIVKSHKRKAWGAKKRKYTKRVTELPPKEGFVMVKGFTKSDKTFVPPYYRPERVNYTSKK